jgi:hypothetical protein
MAVQTHALYNSLKCQTKGLFQSCLSKFSLVQVEDVLETNIDKRKQYQENSSFLICRTCMLKHMLDLV